MVGGRRWLVGAALASAFWPGFVEFDDLPDTPLAERYRAEALTTLGWARNHPLERAFDLLLVQQWRLSDWREVPGSGDGGTSLPEAMDVLVTATALGPWGIPLARYTICCGGAGYTRGEWTCRPDALWPRRLPDRMGAAAHAPLPLPFLLVRLRPRRLWAIADREPAGNPPFPREFAVDPASGARQMQ